MPPTPSIFTSNWLRDAPWVAFERHAWQSHDFWPKRLPKNAPSETGKQHGLASSRTAFFDLRMCDLQCQTSRPEPIKNRGFAAWGLISHLELALKCASTSDRKGFPKMRPPKQRNSMAWRAEGQRFFNLRWGDLQCQTLRPEPLKKDDFPAVGLISHLELASSCFAV